MLIIHVEEALLKPNYHNKQKTFVTENTDQRMLTFKSVFFDEDSFKQYDMINYQCNDIDDEGLKTLVGMHDSREYKDMMNTRISNLYKEKRLVPNDVLTNNKNTLPSSVSLRYGLSDRDIGKINLEVTTNLSQPYTFQEGAFGVSSINMIYTPEALTHAAQGTAIPDFTNVSATFKSGDLERKGTFYYENGQPTGYGDEKLSMMFDVEKDTYSKVNLKGEVTPKNQQAYIDLIKGYSKEAETLLATAKALYPALQKEVHLALN